MKSYPVKENHIGSAVSKILRYTQTDIHTGGRGEEIERKDVGLCEWR
jgi:hypothetical protein